jgi:hypothetical protein
VFTGVRRWNPHLVLKNGSPHPTYLKIRFDIIRQPTPHFSGVSFFFRFSNRNPVRIFRHSLLISPLFYGFTFFRRRTMYCRMVVGLTIN